MEVNKEKLKEYLGLMIDEINDLGKRVTKLEESYEKIDSKLAVIVERLQQLGTSDTTQVLQPENSERVYKNITNLEELLEVVPDGSKKFVGSIVNNEYPTMTHKQHQALLNLAKSLGYDKPLSQ